MQRLGWGSGWGLPTQEARFRQPSKPLHDLDRIPQLCRALQLGLGGVGRRQVAVAGQPVLDQRSEQVRWEGWEGWDAPLPPPSGRWRPHLSPGTRGPPAPSARLPLLSRSRPSSPGFPLDPTVLVPTSPSQPLSRSSDPGPRSDGSKNPDAQTLCAGTLDIRTSRQPPPGGAWGPWHSPRPGARPAPRAPGSTRAAAAAGAPAPGAGAWRAPPRSGGAPGA